MWWPPNVTVTTLYTRSPFVPCMPWRAPTVGETSYRIRVGFIESDIVFTVILIIYLLTGINLLFSVTTLYTTSLTPLPFWTTSISIPIHLSVSNQLSRSKICIQPLLPINNGSQKWSWQYLRRSQLRPAISLSLSLAPAKFGYNLIT